MAVREQQLEEKLKPCSCELSLDSNFIELSAHRDFKLCQKHHPEVDVLLSFLTFSFFSPHFFPFYCSDEIVTLGKYLNLKQENYTNHEGTEPN